MDNVLERAAKRIHGLLITAGIQQSKSDDELIEALERLAQKHHTGKPPETATDALLTALQLVTFERHASHGAMIEGFERIARIWSALLAGRDLEADPLEASEICDMMELLKIARRQSGAFNPDDYIDGAGYAACAFECRQNDAWAGCSTNRIASEERANAPRPRRPDASHPNSRERKEPS